jgi:hypothetical protein
MKTVKSSEWLISENKAGNKKFWRLHIVRDGEHYHTQTEWYQITANGKESKKQLSEPYYAQPTNVGRANQRDSQQPAVSPWSGEARARYLSKIKRPGAAPKNKLKGVIWSKYITTRIPSWLCLQAR